MCQLVREKNTFCLFRGTFPSQLLKQLQNEWLATLMSPPLLGLFQCQGFLVMIEELKKPVCSEQAPLHFSLDLCGNYGPL